MQNWAIKGYYPLVFPGRGITNPMLNCYTAGNKSTKVLKEILKYESPISLPRHIVIEDESRGLKAFLSSQYLTPLPEFLFVSNNDANVVSNHHLHDHNSNNNNNTGGGDNDDDDVPIIGPTDGSYHDSDTEDEVTFNFPREGPSVPTGFADFTLEEMETDSQIPINNTPTNQPNFSLPDGVDDGLDGLGKK